MLWKILCHETLLQFVTLINKHNFFPNIILFLVNEIVEVYILEPFCYKKWQKRSLSRNWIMGKRSFWLVPNWSNWYPQCWTEGQRLTAVAKYFRSTATVVEVWGHFYGHICIFSQIGALLCLLSHKCLLWLIWIMILNPSRLRHTPFFMRSWMKSHWI